MLTFWIILALVEWFLLSLALFTYMRHTTVVKNRADVISNIFWCAIWPVLIVILCFAFAKKAIWS